MSATSAARDPRGIITPDAFHVSPGLLGLPLATPRRRLAAILVDLLAIGAITVATRNIGLVLGIVAAGAFMRAGFRRTAKPAGALERSGRLSIGCLGLLVGLATVVLWISLRSGEDASPAGPGERPRGAVLDVGPARIEVQRSTPAAEPVEARDAQAVRDGVRLYTVEEALETYASLRRRGGGDAMDRELLRALESRLASEVASDTLRALEDRIADLDTEARDARQRLDDAERELDDALSRGIWGWMTGLLDDLGFGFGWAALYMTVLMSMTRGQTLGKRLLGIRVLRLDGQPITWWIAFERAGGYAAGFATGLLGFAQIFWDANRQAIHDRIAGTVVVRDGAERVQDWEAAL